MIVDLFAGPGGWDEGAKPLGLHPIGVEWDKAACHTAMAAGHGRVRADVETFPTEQMRGKVTGLIASPPCQDFSLAGKQAGITGEKGRLIAQVLRWTDELRPEWVACEQVPPCLPVWQEYAAVMRGWGYRTWVGVVNAADYGVPQTRKRAILLASRVRQPQRPATTHSRTPEVGDLFGGYREQWVSMAQALGWGIASKPAGTLVAGDATKRGRNPLDGGSGARRTYETARDSGDWVLNASNGRERTDGGGPSPRPAADAPAPTVTSESGSQWQWVYVNGTMANAARRPVDQPAPTVMFGHAGNEVRWAPACTITTTRRSSEGVMVGRSLADGGVRVTVQEAGILQSFPADYPWSGSRTKQYEQCGNAIPPLLATHLLAEVMGIAVPKTCGVAA